MREFITLTKALADPSRVRVLLALRKQELCVCQIVELLQLAPSTISRHLSSLHHAGLISSRKDERWIYCRLPDKEVPVVVREAIAWTLQSLAKSPQAKADAKSLKKIRKLEPTALCRRQKC